MEKSVSPKEELALLKLARASIAAKLEGKESKTQGVAIEVSPEFLTQKKGLFVTLHKKGKLCGCIGNIEPMKPLGHAVKDNAISAAFHDSRFPPLVLAELSLIHIEISILSSPEKMIYSDPLDLISRLTPGVDGVIIEKNHHKATFLPQVWEQLPKPAEFLAHLCMKAGLSAKAWEKGGLILHTYQVQSFGEIDEDYNRSLS